MAKYFAKKAAARTLLLFLLAAPFVYAGDFYRHFYAYLSGAIITNVIRSEWHIVLISAAISIAFFLLTFSRRKINWAEFGFGTAFFISLFVEMYGVPLTLIFASKYFFKPNVGLPENVLEFTLLDVGFGADIAMAYGIVLIALGMILVLWGWADLYKSAKKGMLATDGAYEFSRHPQYLGFMLIILGWFFGWPTLLTVIFTPILIHKYINLCKTEEEEMVAEHSDYEKYTKRVPFLA